MRGVSGGGIRIDDGAATVTRYRFQQSTGTALAIHGGSADASHVDASGGVFMTHGTLRLTDSSISSPVAAVVASALSNHYGTRDVTIARTTLRAAEVGLDVVAARVAVTDTTIDAVGSWSGSRGISQEGSELRLSGSTVRGWGTCIMAREVFPSDINWLVPGSPADPGAAAASQLEEAVSLTLDDVELTSCGWGISYSTGWYSSTGWLDSRLRLRGSRVAAAKTAVTLTGELAAADLGTAASPGDNALESGAGYPALLDGRGQAGAAMDARATTLNGLTFSGDVLGPVDVSGAYRIAGPNTIRF